MVPFAVLIWYLEMPVYADAEDIIKANLALVAAGKRPTVSPVGRLTGDQHLKVNVLRASLNLPPLIDPEVLYMGRHHYTSRSADGYLIHDMWLQIEAALAASSMVTGSAKMTGLQATVTRHDGYGNQVHDLAILELTVRKPRAELFSCIPKGDLLKPGAGNTKASPAEPARPCVVIPGN